MMELGWEKKVLDHGYVRLIATMGTDQTIIEAARMSTGKGFEGWDPSEACERCEQTRSMEMAASGGTIGVCIHNAEGQEHIWKKRAGDAKLLEFLYRNGHHTPFEMCELAIEVQGPLFVFREWHRHRSQSYNEMSARYIQMPNLHYVPTVDRFQKQSVTNKQGSAGLYEEAASARERLRIEQDDVYSTYAVLVEDGLAKEVARINTPVSRYSRMRAKTDLRNWLGFLKLRMNPAAQWEIRMYANAVAEIIEAVWPRTYALFDEHELNAVKFSKTEMLMLKKMIQDGPPNGLPLVIVKKILAT